jgi:hypothetical protein
MVHSFLLETVRVDFPLSISVEFDALEFSTSAESRPLNVVAPTHMVIYLFYKFYSQIR